MTPAFVKQAVAQSASSTTTVTLTLGSAPTSGNLLVFAMGGDKNTGALTLAGWTPVHSLLQASVSLYVWFKTSAGTETSITPTWASSSAAGNMAWYGEYQDTAVTGTTWELVEAASNISTNTNVNTAGTGTTASTANAGIGIAAAAVDSSQSVTSVSAWGDSYATRYSGTAGSGRGAVFVAEKAEAAAHAATTTFTYTGTADQTSAAIAVFRKVPSGGGTFTGDAAQTLPHLTQAAAGTRTDPGGTGVTYIDDNFTATNGAAWNASYWTSAVVTAGAGATIQSNAGRLAAGTATAYAGRSGQRYAVGTVVDVDITGTVNFTNLATSDGSFSVHVRADSTFALQTGYRVIFVPGANIAVVQKHVASVETQLGSTVTTAISQGQVWSWRFRVIGTAIQFRKWQGTEPGTWDVNVTDTAVSSAGYFGVLASGGNAANCLIDVDTILATNGDTAVAAMQKPIWHMQATHRASEW